jgi:hypothetical protein
MRVFKTVRIVPLTCCSLEVAAQGCADRALCSLTRTRILHRLGLACYVEMIPHTQWLGRQEVIVKMEAFHVGVAAEAFAAGLLAQAGCDVLVQYGANQPEYDLVAIKR